jgi:hypothetical protein
MVCLVCIFITLWVAIGANVHKNYETPTPVRLLNPVLSHPFLISDTTRVSIGAGSVLGTCTYALVVNTSGCGSRYLLRRYYISHYLSGRKVACLLMKRAGTSFTCRSPIRRLITHSGELHWECFCKFIASRAVNAAHRLL